VRKTNEELQKANKQLEFHAVRDPLTGLHNRRSFVELMAARTAAEENDRRENSNDLPDCLILMDIDLFKHINDTWGHSVGDVVLKEVALRLTNCVRESDMVLRWGGEEFLIYSPKSSPEQITKLVERVLTAIGRDVIQVGDLLIPVTVTAGFISLPFSGVSEENCGWEKTLQMADMALYLGKAHGRNRAYGLSKLLVKHEKAMPLIDHDLSAAISAGMVELIEVIGPMQTKTKKAHQQTK
jgi:diguanylate cyclase (GGDEF)-like protein